MATGRRSAPLPSPTKSRTQSTTKSATVGMEGVVKQTYETTIVFPPASGLHIYVVPKRSFLNGKVPTIEELTTTFALKPTGRIDVTPANLANALTALMSKTVMQGPTPEASLKTAFQNTNDSNFAFAEHAAYARIIPSESSPFDLQSLGGLALGAGAIGGGIKVGLIVAAGVAAGVGGVVSAPILLGSVASGVIIVVAANEIGKITGNEIGKKMLEWMGFL
jgi:hypothetical protein